MKPLHPQDITAVNKARKLFLESCNISPATTSLLEITYDRTDFTQYTTVTQEIMGDGIMRRSTLVNDALVATRPNHALFLPLADCIGAVLHDPVSNILMVSHLGRHNLEQFGGTKSVEYLIKTHNINIESLTVWLSPAAGSDRYPLFAFKNRSLHEVAIEQLMNAGISAKNITTSSVDVTKSKNYYSHSEFLKGNRDFDGRFAIVAMIS